MSQSSVRKGVPAAEFGGAAGRGSPVCRSIEPDPFSPFVLENKDVGFVKVGQKVEVKVETFPFNRYGTLTGTVSLVSNDAVNYDFTSLLLMGCDNFTQQRDIKSALKMARELKQERRS